MFSRFIIIIAYVNFYLMAKFLKNFVIKAIILDANVVMGLAD